MPTGVIGGVVKGEGGGDSGGITIEEGVFPEVQKPPHVFGAPANHTG